MNSLQIFATLLSLLYIFFATRNKAICFLFGAIASTCWAYESFYTLNLKFDALLQVFYIFMAFYGAYYWKRNNQNLDSGIKQLNPLSNLLIIVVGCIISFACAKVAMLFFDTNYAFIDALTTGFSIVATVLLVRRYIDNWIYWLFINPVYIFIYVKTGGYLFAGISLLYTVMAVKGYLTWKKEMKLATL